MFADARQEPGVNMRQTPARPKDGTTYSVDHETPIFLVRPFANKRLVAVHEFIERMRRDSCVGVASRYSIFFLRLSMAKEEVEVRRVPLD